MLKNLSKCSYYSGIFFRIVRLTSPKLNYLIVTGAIFFYISTYWYCLPSVDPAVILTACCVSNSYVIIDLKKNLFFISK